VISKCWKWKASSRPSFSELVHLIDDASIKKRGIGYINIAEAVDNVDKEVRSGCLLQLGVRVMPTTRCCSISTSQFPFLKGCMYNILTSIGTDTKPLPRDVNGSWYDFALRFVINVSDYFVESFSTYFLKFRIFIKFCPSPLLVQFCCSTDLYTFTRQQKRFSPNAGLLNKTIRLLSSGICQRIET